VNLIALPPIDSSWRSPIQSHHQRLSGPVSIHSPNPSTFSQCSNTFKRQPHENLVKIAALATLRDDSSLALNVQRSTSAIQSLGAYYLPQTLEQLSFFCETSHQVRLQLPLHHRKSRPPMRFDPIFNNHITTFIQRFRAAKRTHSHSCIDLFFSLQVVPLVMEPAPP